MDIEIVVAGVVVPTEDANAMSATGVAVAWPQLSFSVSSCDGGHCVAAVVVKVVVVRATILMVVLVIVAAQSVVVILLTWPWPS